MEETIATTKKEKKIITERFKETPFVIVQENNEYFGALGNKRITQNFTTKRELKKQMNVKNDWFLVNLISVIAQTTIEIFNEQKK